ncbi:N-ethylmaleimide reductase [Actinacidiphila yanglinensis]|uniref:N-ethylmaleimide reductase n=1 Tax=Actinacidiphila yanglinensis TaxID=310779 RepID=A0A1H6BBU0_9ACTN|nr:alkene reductase [Actinacidiphila yanglinensis]SEG57855.1 N-ethylmaleimide reductase [Actinacidiphila yanglinensis]
MSFPLQADEQALLRPYDLGAVQLRNRVVMAPMTRARATNPEMAPTGLHADYYRQRAGAGLIVTEGTWISPDAIGALNVPGIFSDEQVQGWTGVTKAVHADGGVIYSQLAHTGSSSHPDYRGGDLPVAPSAVNPGGKVFTPGSGFTDTVTPRALSAEEIAGVVEQYRSAALNARRAGFDGVEVHAQRGYLIAQFLNPDLNLRTDGYGGSPEKRARFLFEILDAVTEVWGPHRVGIKFAPHQAMIADAVSPEILTGHEYVAERLNDYPLAYVHLMMTRRPNVAVPAEERAESLGRFRPLYRGTLIANAGLDQEAGNAVLSEGLADLVSFGLPFIANPDLPARFAHGIPLSPPDRDTFYEGGERGYTDYPAAGLVSGNTQGGVL